MKIPPIVSRLLAGRTVAATAAVTALFYLSSCGLGPAVSESASATNGPDLAALTDVMKRVERNYVVPVSNAKLTDNALKGMVSGLDPHSNYLDPSEYQQMRSDFDGKFGGLGMQITQDNGVPKVLAPIDGTPAAQAGIEPGDLIVAIDGLPTQGMGIQHVVSKLRGPLGTKVSLAIDRGNKPPFDVTLTRATIRVDSVKSAMEPNHIGYARISSFTDNTQPELTRAISDLKRQAGGHLSGFILDLRDDPGGELNAAVDVAGDFLDGGTVVTIRGRNGDEHGYTAPRDGDRLAGVPMTVLIDGASASASEIVAGALKDHHRAVIMGTRSFGKGSVQSVMPLDTGGALVLTTALYFTPSGRSIQDLGVTPDIRVTLPADEEVANQIPREAAFANAIKNAGTLGETDDGGNGAAAPPPNALQLSETGALDRPIKPDLIATEHDAQLKAAINYLETHAPTHPL